ncbi:MAG: hypothetical protein J6I46_05505 [Ruminococcus sp.]|nr:hypothetical protein [Ruminococcus sp.]
MKVYLVDFENVKSKGLTGIDSLTEYDRVIIFYSENADTINFEMHQKVLISKAEVEYFKVHVGGKNALDFQLSTLLGYLVSRNYYTHIFVISNDKSFDFLHDFWHGKYIAAPDCTVYRTRTIAQAINYAGGKKHIVEDDDMPEGDTAVFGSVDEAENAVQAEQAETVEVIEEEAAPVEEKAEEPKSAEPAPKQETKPVENSVKPVKEQNDKKQEPKPVKEETSDDIGMSSEELAALEAAFKPYMMVKSADEPEDIQSASEDKPVKEKKSAKEKKQEEKPVKKAAEKAEKKAEPAEDKQKGKKQGKQFFASLKDALKKAECKPDMVNRISQLLIQSETKEELHNMLARDYKQDATDLYKLLRPRYLRLKEMYAEEHPEYVDPNEVVAAQENVQEPKQEPKPVAEKAEAKAKAPAKKEPAKPAPEQTEVPKAEKDRLNELLDGICSAEELEQIGKLLIEAPTKQQFYIRMIKLFGKTKGCKFYNVIKGEYTALSEK